MTAKEYLRRLAWAEVMIDARKRELAKIRSEQTYIKGISYDNINVQTSKSNDMFPGSDKALDLAISVIRSITALQKFRNTVIGQIQGLEKPTHTEVLMLRYVERMSFEQIAITMSYSYMRIIHIHGEALSEFEKKYKGEKVSI